MPPKPKVSRNDILGAARALLEEGGPGLVTARAVADRLGISTRPIYSLFSSMEEVLSAIVPELEAELAIEMAKPWTGREIADRGIGILVYGRDHPAALEYLLSARPGHGQIDRGSRMHREFIDALKTTGGTDSLGDDELEGILFKMEVFTQGLLRMMREGSDRFDDGTLVRLTHDMGEALILHTIMKKRELLPKTGT